MRLKVLDSHTGGEPTRVVYEGGPDLGAGDLATQASVFRKECEDFRRSVCNEPRGHDAMVGALITPSPRPECVCGVIFFNNVAALNMCIHGTIGLVVSLAHLGRIGPGVHAIDTPVGVVHAELEEGGRVTVANVPSYRYRSGVEVDVPGWGRVMGDISWGGNWFFLIEGFGPTVSFENLAALTDFTWAVKAALAAAGITGEGGMEIDHVESFGPPSDPTKADSRNFVMCPGRAYDRSPCGTGTSAKLAALHAAGKLAPGELWRQAGILDTVFEGRIEVLPDGKVLPRVSGHAWVTGESTYHFDPADPFRFGIPSATAI
ncbi:MAG: proline racemase family protein [Akkermansiaceae bacterium]|jgi:4-hydroxyproline epimerase|nr:proline racemase family protein [Akkermansiaceae bacterium]